MGNKISDCMKSEKPLISKKKATEDYSGVEEKEKKFQAASLAI